MSYIRIFDEVDPDGIRALVHEKLIFPADPKLDGSALTVKIHVPGEVYKHTQVFELRISKHTLKSLIKQASSEYSPTVCTKIASLYRVGLGLPHSKECHLLWTHLAAGFSPKVNGRVFSYSNMLRILREHWKQVNSSSVDPNWFYFNTQTAHYKDLLASTFSILSTERFIQKNPPFSAAPSLDGLECTLVYRIDKGANKAHLYAAYCKVNNKFMNFTVQAMQFVRKEIESNVLSSFGPYLFVSGVVSIKARNLSKLRKYWGKDSSVKQLIRCSLDQDVFSLSEMDGVDLPSSHPSSAFVKNYRSKYKKAVRFIVDNSSKKRLSRNTVIMLSKATNLVEKYEEHEQVVNEAKEEKRKLREYDIIPSLSFVAYDMYSYWNEELKRVSNPHESVLKFLSTMFETITTIKPLSTPERTALKLSNNTPPGYTNSGVMYRLADVSSTKTVNWIKVK